MTLPDEHPDKIAAVALAAVAWFSAGQTLERDLHHELASARLANKHLDDAEYAADVKAHRAYARSLQSTRPSFMARRQAQLDAVRPQPGDHPGRSGA